MTAAKEIPRRRRKPYGAVLLLALLAALPLLARLGSNKRGASEPSLRVELRSWVVFGQGRHLYALVFPPDHPRSIAAREEAHRTAPPARSPALASMAQSPASPAAIRPPDPNPPTAAEVQQAARIEYWRTGIRDGYAPPSDDNLADRIAKVQAGTAVRPMLGPADNRLEAAYLVTPAQARELARDRVFQSRYLLLGPNSTSALRAAFRSAGLDLPAHVVAGRGVLGEFPGVDIDPGPEIAAEGWSRIGLPQGPEKPPAWLTRDLHH